MQFSHFITLGTVSYERAKQVIDVAEEYSNMSMVHMNTDIYSWIVAACILFVMYSFMYVSFWYIDKHMNKTKFRLFKFITLGKKDAEDTDFVSTMLYSGLIVFIVILIFTDVLNLIIMNIFKFILGG